MSCPESVSLHRDLAHLQKLLLLVPVAVLLAACDRGDAQMAADVAPVSGAEVFAKCEELTKGLDEPGKSRDHLKLAGSARAECELFLKRFPQSPKATAAKDHLEKAKYAEAYSSMVVEILDAVTAHRVQDAKNLYEKHSPKLDASERESIGRLVASLVETPKLSGGKAGTESVSHRELHRLASAGMQIGVRYRVASQLTSDGETLCERALPNSAFCADGSTRLRVQNNFSGQEALDFYDMRSSKGCFVVHMDPGGVLWVDAFTLGECP